MIERADANPDDISSEANINVQQLKYTFGLRLAKVYRKCHIARRAHRRTWKEFRSIVRELRLALNERRVLLNRIQDLEQEVCELQRELHESGGRHPSKSVTDDDERDS